MKCLFVIYPYCSLSIRLNHTRSRSRSKRSCDDSFTAGRGVKALCGVTASVATDVPRFKALRGVTVSEATGVPRFEALRGVTASEATDVSRFEALRGVMASEATGVPRLGGLVASPLLEGPAQVEVMAIGDIMPPHFHVPTTTN